MQKHVDKERRKETIQGLVKHPGWEYIEEWINEVKKELSIPLITLGQLTKMEDVTARQGGLHILRRFEFAIEEWKKWQPKE